MGLCRVFMCGVLSPKTSGEPIPSSDTKRWQGERLKDLFLGETEAQCHHYAAARAWGHRLLRAPGLPLVSMCRFSGSPWEARVPRSRMRAVCPLGGSGLGFELPEVRMLPLEGGLWMKSAD